MKYRIFLDLDGVLADFTKRVEQITGLPARALSEYTGRMWKAISKDLGFFTKLAWTKTGEELWEALQSMHPVILTGVPYAREGQDWAQQKRDWVDQFLGKDIDVIIKYPGQSKIFFAKKAMGISEIPEAEIWILIDDDVKHNPTWTEAGGKFIHYKNDVELVLKDLLVIFEEYK